MQRLSKRFYNYIIPSILPKVERNVRASGSFDKIQLYQDQHIMIFPNMKCFFLISEKTGYKWQSIPLETDGSPECVMMLQTNNYWPKIAQINYNEYLLIGGGFHVGDSRCFRLNVKARTLKQIKDMPQGKMAHSVIYIPPEREFKRVA